MIAKIVITLGLIAAAIVGATAAWATIPDAGGLIQGCISNGNGGVRVIDSDTQTCGMNETSLAWQQTSPAPDFYVRGHVFNLSASQTFVEYEVCLSGDVATGGGYSVDPAYVAIGRSSPAVDLDAGQSGTQTIDIDPPGWIVSGINLTSFEVTVQVWAVCQNL